MIEFEVKKAANGSGEYISVLSDWEPGLSQGDLIARALEQHAGCVLVRRRDLLPGETHHTLRLGAGDIDVFAVSDGIDIHASGPPDQRAFLASIMSALVSSGRFRNVG